MWASAVCSSLHCFQMICSFLLCLPKRFPLYTILISGVVSVSKGNWTFMQGLWHTCHICALMKFVLHLFRFCILSEWNPQSFIWCFMVFKKCSFKHINKRKCRHPSVQPHSLAAFVLFFLSSYWLYFFVSSLLKTFLYIMLTTVSSMSEHSETSCATQTELTDCLTVILRVIGRCDVTFRSWGITCHHTTGPKDCSGLLKRLREMSLPYTPAPSVMSVIKMPMHLTYLLLGCLHQK